MIVIGLILFLAGVVFDTSELYVLGTAVMVVGAVLALLGAVGHPLGRPHYY